MATDRRLTFRYRLPILVGALVFFVMTGPQAGAAPLSAQGRYPFAGYITAKAPVTSVSATTSVPTFPCGRRLTAVAASAIVYDGSENAFSAAEIYLGCQHKQEVLAALAELDGTFSTLSITVHTGDTMSLSVSCGAGGVTVSVDDQTSMTTASSSSAGAESCSQAEIGDDGVAPSGSTKIVALPPFGSISYSAAEVNGGPLGSVSSSPATYEEGKRNVITTGALSGGTAFTTTKG